ncbi:hypothetical protein M5585_23045 [Serratia ureilytica]
MAPFQDDRLQEIVEWDQVKLLSIRIDRLDSWAKPGCCASATPRTPCRRSAAWASTWRFRTRWPPPTP